MFLGDVAFRNLEEAEREGEHCSQYPGSSHVLVDHNGTDGINDLYAEVSNENQKCVDNHGKLMINAINDTEQRRNIVEFWKQNYQFSNEIRESTTGKEAYEAFISSSLYENESYEIFIKASDRISGLQSHGKELARRWYRAKRCVMSGSDTQVPKSSDTFHQIALPEQEARESDVDFVIETAAAEDLQSKIFTRSTMDGKNSLNQEQTLPDRDDGDNKAGCSGWSKKRQHIEQSRRQATVKKRLIEIDEEIDTYLGDNMNSNIFQQYEGHPKIDSGRPLWSTSSSEEGG